VKWYQFAAIEAENPGATVKLVAGVDESQMVETLSSFMSHQAEPSQSEALVRNLFRPSYGGNRNFTLMYSLGAFLVSADDDMRPHALIESSPESLNADEISRGKLMKADAPGFVKKSFDLLTSFHDVLGRKVGELPANYEQGEMVIDTAMDLETNVALDFAGDNSLLLKHGPVPRNAVVKMAQTFRTDLQRYEALGLFAENLARSFYGFEPDFFQQNVTRIVDDVISVIHASLELWPTLVEICYFYKDKKDFPQMRVNNKKIKSHNGRALRAA